MLRTSILSFLFVSWVLAQPSSSVPELPFPDNPDPSQCGIPEVWREDKPAWLTGYFEGELIQPVVFLYDSHSRRQITGQTASGTQVEIVLVQVNPVLNYYQVRTPDGQEGWVPGPFVTFQRPSP